MFHLHALTKYLPVFSELCLFGDITQHSLLETPLFDQQDIVAQ